MFVSPTRSPLKAKLEQSVRSQERALADQMLQEDLRRAREIRQAAMDAKNGGSSAAATCQPPPSAALSASTLATSLRCRRSISPHRSPIKGLGMSTTLSQARAFGKPGGAVENVLLDENKALRDRLNGKTNEGFELQRQLNRAQEAAREKDRVAAVLRNQVNRNDRELKSRELQLNESLANAARLHDMADRVREEDDAINEENALLEERIHHLREDLNKAEAAINAARVKQDQTEQNCDFRLNIAEEGKSTLEHELDNARDELRAFALELQSYEDKFEQKDAEMAKVRGEMARLEEENSRVSQKAKEWHDEAERLRRLIDEKNRLHFEIRGEGDTQLKHLKLELHEIQSQCAVTEVEKNVLSAAKLDLTHEVSRLKRRSDEREEQVKRLLRLLEEKDQTIAEMGPAMRDAKRASSAARTSIKKKSQHNGWRA